MSAAGGSHIGLRKNNEDSYYINEACRLFVIADGMGGHEHGKMASRMAVEHFMQMADDNTSAGFSLEQMERMLEEANQEIYSRQEALHIDVMGTTLTAVKIADSHLYAGHIGDSRLYLYRDEELTQLTQDHSYYAELLRQGNTDIPLENRQKNVLLKALGPEETAEGQFFEEEIYPDDILLLCTDGLYNAVSHAELQQMIEHTTDLQSTVNDMIALALSHGASDNITAILYRHDGEVMAW
jgi:protein phosphatase